jgi:AbrB family looped-hinge helix DNA binding protein
MEAYVTSRGRVVIPAVLRRRYGIHVGTKLEFTDDGDRIIIRPITAVYIRSLRGFLKGGGALEALEADRETEKGR